MTVQEKYILRGELNQRREEGCDVSELAPRIDAALAVDSQTTDAEFVAFYEALEALEVAPDFPFEEPSTLEEIRALRPDGPRRLTLTLSDDELKDRIHGAWLGRAAGCALGKPVEGWPKERIDAYLENAGALPLTDYLPYVEKVIAQGLKSCTRGNIAFMDRDDDMDFSILGLLILERKGASFTPRNMANQWLANMPYQLVYTAESAAYRNFVNQRWPPASAAYRNPAREWIGAQIRADAFGWVAPGWPEKAAELAFKDASISHVKNGIYGEMLVAAMIAAAFVTEDVNEIVKTGLSEIPANCRLAEAVRDTVGWCARASTKRGSDDWEAVWQKIHDKYGHYSGVHTINNAALVIAGLHFGATDFGNGIITTVRSGWDTDCTGATVGSILGAKEGAVALPEQWVGVMNDRLHSAVLGCNDSRISDLAERTFAVAKAIAALPTAEPDPSRPEVEMAPDMIGTWELTVSWGALTLEVEKNGARLEQHADGEVYKLTDFQADGNTVRFSYTVGKGGWDMEMPFEGRVDGDTLMGEFNTSNGDFAVTGTKKP